MNGGTSRIVSWLMVILSGVLVGAILNFFQAQSTLRAELQTVRLELSGVTARETLAFSQIARLERIVLEAKRR